MSWAGHRGVEGPPGWGLHEDSKYVVVDTETTGLFHKTDRPFLLILADDKEQVELVKLSAGRDLSWLLDYKLIFFNAKFDLKMLIEWGYLPRNCIDQLDFEDVFLMAKLHFDREGLKFDNQGKAKPLYTRPYSMKMLYRARFGSGSADEEKILKLYLGKLKRERKKKGDDTPVTYQDLPDEIMTPYALADGKITGQLYEWYLKNGHFDQALYQQEKEVLKMLLDIELTGVPIDLDLLHEWELEIAGKLMGMDLPVKQPAATLQVQEYIYHTLGLDCIMFTDKGKAAVDERVLEPHAEKYPGIAAILRWRKLNKLKETYLRQFRINAVDGRLFMNFNQTEAVTGRMSCSSPNLQNLPSKEFEGYDIRSIIRAEKGCKLAPIDLSQIEIRVFAYYANDPEMIRAINEGLDWHTVTAAMLYGVPMEQVTKAQRKSAKTINFGIIYGMGKKKLARSLEISEVDASRMLFRYHDNTPSIQMLTAKVKQRIWKTLDRDTGLGRLTNAYGRVYNLHPQESYKGLNRLIQGTSADLFKANAVRVWKALKGGGSGIRPCMFVHDETVFQVPAGEEPTLFASKALMCDSSRLGEGIIPIQLDAAIGELSDHYYKD